MSATETTLDAAEDAVHRLIEELAAVTEMTSSAGWQIVERYAGAWAEAIQKRLLSGSYTDLTDYKVDTGRLDGARQVLRIRDRLEDALERARQDILDSQPLVEVESY